MTKKCKTCKTEKPLQDFSASAANAGGFAHSCKSCVCLRNKQYWQSPKGRISYIYSTQRANSKVRNHPLPDYSKAELFDWAIKQGLHQLIADWKAAGFPKELAPSVDRLNNDQGYSLNNIRLVRWKDNNEQMYLSRKIGHTVTRQNKRVVQYALTGEKIAEYPSIALAARTTGITRTNISAMCVGKPHVKSVGGFLWKHI